MAAQHQGRPLVFLSDELDVVRRHRINQNRRSLHFELAKEESDQSPVVVAQGQPNQSLRSSSHRRTRSLGEKNKVPFTSLVKNKQWEEEREKLSTEIKRLSVDVRKLEKKIADMKNASEWIGLDKKKHRKKMIKEMKFTYALKKKELEQKKLTLFKTMSDVVQAKEKKQKVMVQICSMKQVLKGKINKGRQILVLDEYSAENTRTPEEWEELMSNYIDIPNHSHNGHQIKEIYWDDVLLKENGRLGGGCFGDVCEGFAPSIGKVAVKILRPTSVQAISFQREIRALKRTTKCPLIVKLKGFCQRPHYALFTELCEGGSLDTILFKKAIRLPEKVAVHIALQVAEAMHHLLSMTPPIFHRDLSTANVFLRRRNDYESVCLGDFGIAVEVANGEVYPNDPSDKSKNGNPRYRAPEVTLTGRYHKKSDVYSFGNLFFELLTSSIPFPLLDAKDVALHIAQGHVPNKDPKFSHVDKKIRKLVIKCWSMNPASRPSFHEIMLSLKKWELKQRAKESK